MELHLHEKIADMLNTFGKEHTDTEALRELLCNEIVKAYKETNKPDFFAVANAIKIALIDAEPKSLDHITDVATATAFANTGWADCVPKPKPINWAEHVSKMSGGRRQR